MHLIRLGLVPPLTSMAIFHALARQGVEALVVTSPAEQFVSVGYFQDPQQVLDLEFCRERGLAVVRREIGGGAVLLDAGQVFYHVVLKRDNPLLPGSISGLYELFSQPPIDTYRRFGVDVAFRPVNDLVTKEGRKIAGEGGANIGDCLVFVGSIIIDFDVATMARALRIPDEKFRGKLHRTIEDSMSTLKRELGYAPPRQEVEATLIAEFERLLGPLAPLDLDADFRAFLAGVEQELADPAFVFTRSSASPGALKIKEGTHVAHGNFKAPGGLVSVTLAARAGAILDLAITGDFTMYPKEELANLEAALRGQSLQASRLEAQIAQVLASRRIDAPGVAAADFAAAVLAAGAKLPPGS